MSTIVFLTHRYFDNFHFDKIVAKDDRLVCIILDSQLETFPHKLKTRFNKIYPAPRFKLSHGALVKFDHNTVKKILEKELKINPHLKLICVDEGNMMLAATLRDELNLGAPGVKEMAAFKNKATMKEKLKNTNTRIPHFLMLDEDRLEKNPMEYYVFLKKTLGNKFVLKPLASAASYGVYIINSAETFMDFYNSEHLTHHEYEAEEFIEGDLHNCDIAIKNGKVLFEKCCQYSHPNIDFTEGRIIGNLELIDKNPLKKKLLDFAKEALKNLEAPNGTFHMEVFYNKEKGPIFLEVAARPVGAAVALMYEAATGTNLFDVDLSIHLNKNIKWNTENKQFSMQALIPINPTTISKLKKIKFHSKRKIHWVIDPNKPINIQNSASVVDIAAKLLLTSQNYKDIEKDFRLISEV